MKVLWLVRRVRWLEVPSKFRASAIMYGTNMSMLKPGAVNPWRLLGSDAHHRVLLSPSLRLFPTMARITSEALLPEVVAQDHHRMGSRSLAFLVHEKPARLGFDAQEGEHVPGDRLAPDRLRGGFRLQAGEEGFVSGHAGKDVGLIAEIHQVGIGGNGVGVAGLGPLGLFTGVDLHQLLGGPHGHARKEDGVHQAEDGRVGSDPQRQGKDGDGGETRGLGHAPEGVANVLNEAIHGFFFPQVGPWEAGAGSPSIRHFPYGMDGGGFRQPRPDFTPGGGTPCWSCSPRPPGRR